jgi:hypothetical protein
MPNWCYNTVRIKHEDAQVIDKVQQAFLDGKLLETLIPYPNGEWDYQWCVNNWGTKWDVGGDSYTRPNPFEILLTFDSAWAPPINAYQTMVEQGFQVKASYYEPGMAFAGVWEDGFDDYYEYGGMTADEIEATLPQELNEEYGIAEQVAEWEAEQEENDE